MKRFVLQLRKLITRMKLATYLVSVCAVAVSFLAVIGKPFFSAVPFPTLCSSCEETVTFRQSSAVEARRRLRAASSTTLVARRTRLSTIGHRALPVAAFRQWNTLPTNNVTSAWSVTACFRKRLKTLLFKLSVHQSPVVPEQ